MITEHRCGGGRAEINNAEPLAHMLVHQLKQPPTKALGSLQIVLSAPHP
jgi:hypothetical protein